MTAGQSEVHSDILSSGRVGGLETLFYGEGMRAFFCAGPARRLEGTPSAWFCKRSTVVSKGLDEVGVCVFKDVDSSPIAVAVLDERDARFEDGRVVALYEAHMQVCMIMACRQSVGTMLLLCCSVQELHLGGSGPVVRYMFRKQYIRSHSVLVGWQVRATDSAAHGGWCKPICGRIGSPVAWGWLTDELLSCLCCCVPTRGGREQ